MPQISIENDSAIHLAEISPLPNFLVLEVMAVYLLCTPCSIATSTTASADDWTAEDLKALRAENFPKRSSYPDAVS